MVPKAIEILIPNFDTSNPITCSFRNIFSHNENHELFFIMDISHLLKKIRKNISKSGEAAGCKRHLKVQDNFIEWDYFKEAYLWDISSNPFPIHHKLTQENIRK